MKYDFENSVEGKESIFKTKATRTDIKWAEYK